MNAVIYGRRRQGKSTLALSLAIGRKKPIVVFDPNAQFDCGPIIPVSAINDVMEAGKPIAIIRPNKGMIPEDFNSLIEILEDWDNYVIICDETSTLQNRQSVLDGLEFLMRQAPDAVDVIQTTHRVCDTQRLVRSLATDIFIFKTTLSADIDIIEDEYGKTVANYAKQLGLYQCIHYWLERGGEANMSVWNKPESWYVRIRE